MTEQDLDWQGYKPFLVDWRFLPEPALYAKDWLRRALLLSSNWAARQPSLAPLWRATLGRDTLKAILKAKYLFIHIPKTAGTSVSACLYGKNLPPYPAQFYNEVFGKQLVGIQSFALIRHPLDRLVSGFNMALNGGTDILAYDRFETSKMRRMNCFSQFVDYIYVNRDRLSSLPTIVHEQAGYVQDRHGRVIVDRLFAMDRIKGPPDELTSWLGVQRLPHLNACLKQQAELKPGDRHKILQIYERDFDLYRNIISG